MTEPAATPPTTDLFRAVFPGAGLREEGDGPPILSGHMYRFNEWTEINSEFEGNFMEQIAPGAGELDSTKITFQHGRDPELGDKLLTAHPTVREDEAGGYYEGPLLPGIPELVVAGLRAGAYGASFRFSVLSEDFNRDAEPSDYNPKGLPERTITKMHVAEGGPVTFPAYKGATAGVRSVTDIFRPAAETIADLIDRPRDLARMIEDARENKATEGQPHEEPPAAVTTEREEEAVETNEQDFRSLEEVVAAQADVSAQIKRIDADHAGRAVDGKEKAEWDALVDKFNDLEKRRKDMLERQRVIELMGDRETNTVEAVEPHDFKDKRVQVTRDRLVPDNIYEVDQYRTNARSAEELHQGLRDGAMRSVENAEFPTARTEDAQGHISRLLDTIDFADHRSGKVGSELARRILGTGSPEYKRAFTKYLTGKAMTPEEQRALSFVDAAHGAAAVVYSLDPTIVPTSNFSVNPWRAIARNEKIAGTNEWKAVTSGAITAAYGAEALETSDNAPTLAQPDIIAEKAQALVPFSIEIGQDWGALASEMGQLLADAKDDLEATKFTLGAGHGSTEPKGVITGATNTTGTTTTAAFVIADVYKLFEALPPRFRPRAKFAANLFIIDKIRQFDTSGGSGVWLGPASFGLQANSSAGEAGAQSPGVQVPLLGRGVYESTAMGAALTTTTKILLVGDFRYFVIVDRVGLDVEVVPMLFGTAHFPTGQRALYAYWRNSSDVMSAAAFRVLVT